MKFLNGIRSAASGPLAWAVLLTAALSFATIPAASGSGEVSTAAVPAPTVDYTFDGTLTDAAGGSTLTPAGPCPADPCNSSTAFGSDAVGPFWTWSSTDPRGGGLTVETTASIGDTYTLALKFSFAAVGAPGNNFRKIVDYKSRTSDNGFYFLDGALTFFPFPEASSSTYPADIVLDLVAVRQATGTPNPESGTFTVYAVGSDGLLTLLFTIADPDGESIPDDNGSGGTRLGFFFDDIETDSEATPGGRVYDLRVWANRALTTAELEEALGIADAADLTSPPVLRFTG